MSNRLVRRDPAGTSLALVFLALGGFMVLRSGDMTAMGAVFPRAIGIAMAVFSVALIARNLLLKAKVNQRAESGEPGLSRWRQVALVTILLVWAFAMTRLGFFTTAALAMMLLVFVASFDALSPKRLLVYGLSVIAIAVGAYLLFVHALLVPAPSGILI